MPSKKTPNNRNVLLDQPQYIQDLYADWDYASIKIAALLKLKSSNIYKSFSYKKKRFIKKQLKYLKKYFEALDGRIVLDILG